MNEPDQNSEALFSPLALGPKTARNRFIFASHQTNFAVHHCFEARHGHYYAARAAGGVGLIVLEASVVDISDRPYEYVIFGFDQAVVPGYQQMAEAIHRHGALVLAQLTHSGMQGSSHFSQLPLWGPSAVPEVNSREMPKIMEIEDIETLLTGFEKSAKHAMEGGLDGIEINAGQDSLLRQFLSPLTNLRDDDYGGNLANRLHLLRRVIQTVRSQVGDQGIVGLRLCGDEYAPWAGLKPEDTVEIAGLLANDEPIDFISVTSGSIYSNHLTRPGLYMPPGFAVHLAAGIKAALPLQMPVFAQGSIVDPPMAAQLVIEQQADGVEMTRALIADPELPNKLRAGHRDDIRPCLLSNQDNIVGIIQNPRLHCVNNPVAGYENDPEFVNLPSAPVPQRVMVVGAGPAGLEAARVAALRGHQVTLYEQKTQLGGSLRLAAQAPGRERLALAVDWLENQVRKLGVKIETGVEVTAELIRGQLPDAVIIAVGGLPGSHPTLHNDGTIPVLTPRQVFGGEISSTAGKVIVIDGIGDQVGMGVSEWLADHGWQVEVITSDMFVGQRLTASLELTAWNQRACAKGIAFRPQIHMEQISDRTLIGVDVFDHHSVPIGDVDLIVDVCHELPNESLYFTLKHHRQRVFRAGDCVAPRYLSQAILEGYRVGREV